MIEIVDLCMSFYDKCILDHISVDIEENKITAFSGDSGSGKTTLLNCIAGFIQNYMGKIIIDGKEMEKKRHLARGIYKSFFSYVMQDISLINTISIEQNCSFAIGAHQQIDVSEFKSRLDYYFDLFEVNGIKKKYPFELSGGEKRRVEIAKALALETKYTILDEPTSNLDKNNRKLVIKAIKHSKSTVIVASHDKELLEVSNSIYNITKKDKIYGG